jgi:hypothetical protein
MGRQFDLIKTEQIHSKLVISRKFYQNGVQVFDPKWIDGSVKDEPDVIRLLHLKGLAPQSRKDPVRPIVGGHVQSAEHLTRRDGLKEVYKPSLHYLQYTYLHNTHVT